MKLKKEYIIALIIIAASATYLLLQKDSKVNYEIPRFTQISKEDISSISITGIDESLELIKKGENWILKPGDHKVDAGQINQLLTEAENLSIVDLISSRSDYVRYELEEEKARRVVISDTNGPVKEFLVGKASDSGIYSYIKLPGVEGVYSLRGDMKSKFSLSQDKWRDKQVMDFNPEEIVSVEIVKDSQSVLLSKSIVTETPQWTIDGTIAENQEEIESNIQSVSRLKCTAYMEGNPSGIPLVTVNLSTGMTMHTIELFEKLDKGYSARSSSSKGLFLLPFYLGDMILEMF